jgi:hypothetical protein
LPLVLTFRVLPTPRLTSPVSDSVSDSDPIRIKSAAQIRTALNSINTLLLCLKLSLAMLLPEAMLTLRTPSPRNGHVVSQTRGHGAAPTSPSDPDRPPDECEQDGPAAPRGEPTPPDGRSDGGPNENDGTDEDEQDRDEGNDNEPSGPHGEPNNMTVQDLLCLLGPILVVRPDPPPAIAPNAQRLKVNVPDKFDGRNPKKLKSFLVSCNNAFRADPDTFRLHDKHVSYALSYLCGSAQCHFDTQLEDEDEVDFIPPGWLHDWPRFVEELCKMFGDPNAEATMEAELDRLRMRNNQKFAEVLVDFNMLSSQVNWGDRTLRHRLKQALPNRIKDSLTLVEEPAAFNEWKHLVQNIDQWYWERQAEIRWDARPNPGTNTSRGTPVPNMCNAVSGAPATSAMSVAHGPPSNPPIACHLTAQGGLTQTEQDRQIAQGLCLYCGGQGHEASECSKAQKSRETTGRAAQFTTPVSVPICSSTPPVEPDFTVISEN